MENATTEVPPERAADEQPGTAVSDVRVSSTLLRGGATFALLLWVIGVGSTMWLQWEQLDGASPFQNAPEQPRMLAVLAVGFTQTWGYLLVAVLAFAAAELLDRSGAGPAAEPAVGDVA